MTLYRAEVGAVRKDEIGADVQVVERPVHLVQHGHVVDLVVERHELDAVVRIDAVEDGDLALAA